MSQLVQTPFTRTSTASEVIDGVDPTGKTAIVTGAGSGLGIETARALASAGAEVTLAVRRPQAAEEIAAASSAPPRGGGRCTSCSATPESWRCPNWSARARAGRYRARPAAGVSAGVSPAASAPLQLGTEG
jgi:NAD(P)-dependent dehydrogenase (short-subunit alcohol dehydrogenase family)